MWAKTGTVKIGDIGNGYYQAIFGSQLDYDRALYGGPWTVDDQYIASEPWRLDFDPDYDVINKTMVWVCLPRLPMAYFDEEILESIGSRLGRVVKIDYNTVNGFRGNYARICIEIDLRKRLVPKYRLKRRVRRVEYEGLDTVCYECGHHGHLESSCPSSASMANATPEHKTVDEGIQMVSHEIRPEVLEDYGPWMIATRAKRNKNPTKGVEKKEVQGKGNLKREEQVGGSRFSALKTDVEDVGEEKNDDKELAEEKQKADAGEETNENLKENKGRRMGARRKRGRKSINHIR
ncbi:unnamed protein product [Linum trigynum]|uniref:CCHC-type domain-containing protein n=1 Tax=Linum trigynum TaxID=586398 RepID=A0AAV2DFQ4_9ROSI